MTEKPDRNRIKTGGRALHSLDKAMTQLIKLAESDLMSEKEFESMRSDINDMIANLYGMRMTIEVAVCGKDAGSVIRDLTGERIE